MGPQIFYILFLDFPWKPSSTSMTMEPPKKLGQHHQGAHKRWWQRSMRWYPSAAMLRRSLGGRQRHLPLFAWPWWLKTYDHWERLPSIFPAVLIIGKITKNQSVQLCWFLWDNWAFECFWPVYENWKENGDFLSQIRDNLRIVTNKWQPRDFSKLWFSHNLARSSKLSGQEG